MKIKLKKGHLAGKIIKSPSIEELDQMFLDGYCETPDGCATEFDGICEHGYPSWFVIMGLV